MDIPRATYSSRIMASRVVVRKGLENVAISADKGLRSRPVEKFIRGIGNGIIIHSSRLLRARHSYAFSFRRKIVFRRRTRVFHGVFQLCRVCSSKVKRKLDSFRFYIEIEIE